MDCDRERRRTRAYALCPRESVGNHGPYSNHRHPLSVHSQLVHFTCVHSTRHKCTNVRVGSRLRRKQSARTQIFDRLTTVAIPWQHAQMIRTLLRFRRATTCWRRALLLLWRVEAQRKSFISSKITEHWKSNNLKATGSDEVLLGIPSLDSVL